MISCNLRRMNVDVAFSVPKKLDCLIRRGKDKLEFRKQTNLVYQINCRECDALYIGQTKRSLETRVGEHRRNINLS
ncbi:hypothetical protein X777_04814 [Ooceraea biroi]|uniref:GIY-YIG domain-containing protein n=1 Tax=Ooceraea biroi TaxID=2015173 RepID=A0A026WI65_OOCBI|nr:hypothetical protein X777_04814 [Ooceraea biroi]